MQNRLTNCSRTEVSYLLGVSPSMISKLKKQGIPTNSDGTYDLRSVYLWDQERALDRAGTGESDETLATLAEWRSWKARREELAFRRESGDLVPLADVKTYIQESIGRFRAALGSLSARLSAQLEGRTRRQIEQAVEVETYALLKILARGGEYTNEAAAELVNASGGLTPFMRKQNEGHYSLFKKYYWEEKTPKGEKSDDKKDGK